MQSNFQVKQFFCPDHPKETIVQVSKNPNKDKIFYCLECIIEESVISSSSFIKIEDLISDIYAELSQVKSLKIETHPPESLCSILYEEVSLLANFAEYINLQKQKILEHISSIEEDLKDRIRAIRDYYIVQVNNQFNLFKSNIRNYKEKLTRFFKLDLNEDVGISKERMLFEINQCNTVEDLKVQLAKYYAEIDEYDHLKGHIGADYQMYILQNLKTFRKKIDGMIGTIPEIQMTFDQKSSEMQFESIKQSLEVYIRQNMRLVNPLSLIDMTFSDENRSLSPRKTYLKSAFPEFEEFVDNLASWKQILKPAWSQEYFYKLYMQLKAESDLYIVSHSELNTKFLD